jgi:hypothetical protein
MKLVEYDDKPESRSFWRSDGDTPRGCEIIAEARRLSTLAEYRALSDSEILRIAFLNTGDKSQ